MLKSTNRSVNNLQYCMLYLCVFVVVQLDYGQTTNPKPSGLPITESAIKQLFKFVEKTESELTWNACYDTDSTYDSSDTITLYNDPYYYLSAHCCFITTWYFNPNTSTFNITRHTFVKNLLQPPLILNMQGSKFARHPA